MPAYSLTALKEASLLRQRILEACSADPGATYGCVDWYVYPAERAPAPGGTALSSVCVLDESQQLPVPEGSVAVV